MRRGSSGISLKKSTDYLVNRNQDLIKTFVVNSYADFAPVVNWKGVLSGCYFLTDEGVEFPVSKDTPCAITFSVPGLHKVSLYGVPKSDIRIMDSQSPVIASSPWAMYGATPVMSFGNFALVWYDGTTYHTYYGYDSYHKIGHATSSDGMTWTDDTANNPVLEISGSGTCDQTTVAVANVWQEGAVWYMLYRGNGANTCLATSADGLDWTKYASNPVILGQPDPAGIMKVGSTYWLYANTTGGNRSVSVYTSTDLHAWTLQTPSPLMLGYRYCSCPFKYNGKYYLLVSKYYGPSNVGGVIELFSSFAPDFLDLEYLGVAIYSAVKLDTPTIITDTIYRDTFPANKLMCYYAGLVGGNAFPMYLTVQDDIAAAINAVFSPNTYNCVIGNGNINDGWASHSLAGSRFYMQRSVARESKQITNIQLLAASAYNMKVAVYSDLNGLPDALLAQSANTVITSGTNRLSLITPITLVKGVGYWLVVNQSVGNILKYNAYGNNVRWVASTYANAFPDTMPTTDSFTADLSISGWNSASTSDMYLL